MATTISIYIVEDHQLIVDAWVSLLKQIDDFEVVGNSDNSDEAIEGILSLRPDIVLMDINIKGGSGIDVAAIVNDKLPKTRVIGLSIHDDMAFVKRFFQNGARGYLSKNTTKEELEAAIRSVYDGDTYVCKEIKDKQFFNNLSGGDDSSQKELTAKEIEITTLIAQGLTSRQIADKLFVSRRTVDAHRHNILKKLNLANAALLSAYAKDKGYI